MQFASFVTVPSRGAKTLEKEKGKKGKAEGKGQKR
jgi:hypothetical protein